MRIVAVSMSADGSDPLVPLVPLDPGVNGGEGSPGGTLPEVPSGPGNVESSELPHAIAVTIAPAIAVTKPRERRIVVEYKYSSRLVDRSTKGHTFGGRG